MAGNQAVRPQHLARHRAAVPLPSGLVVPKALPAAFAVGGNEQDRAGVYLSVARRLLDLGFRRALGSQAVGQAAADHGARRQDHHEEQPEHEDLHVAAVEPASGVLVRGMARTHAQQPPAHCSTAPMVGEIGKRNVGTREPARPTVGADQSRRMPASWMILIHLSYSALTKPLSLSGGSSSSSPPLLSNRGLSSGSAWTISCCRRATTAGGVLAGANSPIQESISSPPTPDSVMVGTSGICGLRLAVRMATPFA